MKIVLFLCLLLSAACTQTSHIPAPWDLPGAVIGTTLDNVVYSSRRKKVKSYIHANYLQLKEDVVAGQGQALLNLFDLAKVKSKRQALINELQNSESAYWVDEVLSPEGLEKLTIAVMVYSN